MEIVRKSISFPKELADKISERAEESRRSFSAQVIYELTPKIHEHPLHFGKYTALEIDELDAADERFEEYQRGKKLEDKE